MRLLSWGIDFGTSTMRAAVRTTSGVDRLALGTVATSVEEQYSIPSAIRVDAGGDFTVGERALSTADDRCIFSLKRLLEVRRTPYREFFKVRGWPPKSPWELRGDVVAHREYGDYPMVSLVARMLREVQSRSSKALGVTLQQSESRTLALLKELPLVIGCSAVVGHHGRKVLSDAAREAGFSQVTIDSTVTEPTAAALSFETGAEGAKPASNVLVIDFGAGTLDVSMVRVTKEGVSICAEHGEVLGGDDFDVRMRDLLVEKTCAKAGLEPQEVYAEFGNGRVYAGELRLLKVAEQCKIRLSNAHESQERIPFKGKVLSVNVSRKDFEARCNDLCRVLGAVLDAVLTFSKYWYGIEATSIQRVLLIGGTTRIPLVQQTIHEYLAGCAFTTEAEVHPIFAVAEGTTQADQIKEIDAHRPPYDIEIDIVFTDGSTEQLGLSKSYDELFPLRVTQNEPRKAIKAFFDRRHIESARARFRWNSGTTMDGREVRFVGPAKNSIVAELFHNGRLVIGNRCSPEVTSLDDAPMYSLLPRKRSAIVEPVMPYHKLYEWHKELMHTDVG